MNWDLNIAIGEFLGSFVLTLAVILTNLTVKKNETLLNTPLKKRLVSALSIGAAVVAGILTAKGLGAGGAINPAVALMVALWKNSFSVFILEVGFELLGAVAAAIVGIAWAKSWKDSPKLEDTFKFSEQKVGKVFGVEAVANVFWLLPVMAIIAADTTLVSNPYGVSIAAALSLVVVIVAVEEMGAPNLNPQVWFGMFIVKLVAQKGKISGQNIVSELTSLVAVMAVAAAIGGIFYGVNPA